MAEPEADIKDSPTDDMLVDEALVPDLLVNREQSTTSPATSTCFSADCAGRCPVALHRNQLDQQTNDDGGDAFVVLISVPMLPQVFENNFMCQFDPFDSDVREIPKVLVRHNPQ